MEKIPKNLTFIGIILGITVLCFSEASLLPSSEKDESNKNLTMIEKILIQEKTIIHWYPYQRIIYTTLEDGTIFTLPECPVRPPAVEEFPHFWTRQQRLRGLFLIHIIVAVYCFIGLAIVCDKYFLPTVERICQILNISQDVAAATFMATATTIPEFFANTIATFITESDMGLSAIIGSMLFNTLGVAACASLFIKKPIQIHWWPITRDSILFVINLSLLITFAWDGLIMWYEATILVSMLIFHWVFMFQNDRIARGVKYVIEERFLWCQRIRNYDIVNQRPNDQSEASSEVPQQKPYIETENVNFDKLKERRQSTNLAEIYTTETQEDESIKLYEIPYGVSKFQMFWFFFTWPAQFLLYYTIPHPFKFKKLFPISFIMCIIWIGLLSYIVFWMIVIIGDTFLIPDPIMALTFLAFGGCMPEAISAIIVVRKGSGQMGVSNSLGANCLAIIFSLGLPWFIKTMADGAGFNNAHIRLYSYGVEFTLMMIILAVVLLYGVLAAAGYKLRKTVGGILFLGYIGFATFAILVELDILFERECK
ncbi:hypothetical protein PVAND_016369 [Polypedilum vanderplanki]|uniref:Sodium/calcium exchanger membrane region domain-containing protein n=1 Tax=Polypedilum vanderplanki TaxID=319348 RepID=A0A9J6BF90_POLVA|nr:hypothetical protein PVAND_016369 [Polypedilum vanderplanki]